MWVEKEGAYGNAERRTQFWHQLVKAPAEARSDVWQMMEFSKRFTTDEVWPAEILTANPTYRGKTLFEVLFRNGNVDRFPLAQIDATYDNAESKAFGFYVQKGLFEEYATFGRGHGHDLAPFDTYHQVRGCVGRWSMARKRSGGIARVGIRSLLPARGSRSMATRMVGRKSLRFLMSRRPNLPIVNMICGW